VVIVKNLFSVIADSPQHCYCRFDSTGAQLCKAWIGILIRPRMVTQPYQQIIKKKIMLDGDDKQKGTVM